ncbi:thiol:disulfide interchange protein DsbA/DsbL [Sulfuricystis thermophila]|uniref:thiol:disulfide interchange protein DsbA/DsbL n=1 Tax=Sulfuricystis thermophila TaxID=2496847 RepID=UPI001035E8BD|nr:thiol:disulfide interchange protein DsbA/DsbL [Sulfuricystis thermophila]
MSVTRREFHRVLLAGSLIGTGLTDISNVLAAPAMKEGIDWSPVNPPQPSDTPGKIEVLEFFSYGCPHCREMHPHVMNWAARLPGDVAFRRVPVSFGRAAWANLVKLYYTLEAEGQLDRLDQAVFDAIHVRRVNLFTDKAIFDWIGAQGVDREKFRATFASFSIGSKLARAEALTANYKVDAVPRMVVGGRYNVLGHNAKTYDDIFVIASTLIDKVRHG